MKFSESFLTELAERNDIVDVVGSYVNLSKKSGSNYFGLCPFHNEKTPSFSVSPDKQIYHCFGCGKGGGVINFIMEIESLKFPEAVEFLAKRAGMKIPDEDNDAESKMRSRIYSLNKDAARFFFEQLKSDKQQLAIDYLKKRQIYADTAKSFGIGYAPNSWDSLYKAMTAKGYTREELLKADLVRPGKNGGVYDTFRNRLVFPVIDVRDNVIGFSGRMLGDGEPKYLNSKDTPVFTKGKNLFGLNLAKKSKSGYLILVEGNVDVVMLHQAGFDSAVASLGTSLTNEQARLISRFTDELIIAYDADGAGLKAAQRAIDILGSLNVKVKVLRMSGAKDPDEYIKLNGSGAFRNLIEKSESQIDYLLSNLAKKYDISIPEQKVDYLKEASSVIASFPSEVTRQVYSMRVSEITGVSSDVIEKEVEYQRSRQLSKAKVDFQKKELNIGRAAQPNEKSIKYENPESAVAEEGIIRLLYLDPALAKNIQIQSSEFSSPELGHIFDTLLEKITSHSPVNIAVLGNDLSKDEISLFVRITDKPEKISESANTLSDYINKIRDCSKAGQITDLRDLANELKEKGKGYIK